MFIKEEDLSKLMNDKENYSFCIPPKHIKEFEFSRTDYISGYIIDVYMIFRNKNNSGGLVWII